MRKNYNGSPVLSEIAEIASMPIASERLQNDPLETARWMLEQSQTLGHYEQSLLHTHEHGLHSVMLFDFGRAGKVRMFFAEGGQHTLAELRDMENDLRCRLHDHRFGAALVPLMGDVLQIRSAETTDPEATTTRMKYRYGSAILRHASGFTLERLGVRLMADDQDELLVPGDVSFLTSDDLHSVNTTPECTNSSVAWLVVEGAEVKSDSILYSTVPDLPEEVSTEGLYIPASKQEAAEYVRQVLTSMAELKR